ncbi:hypothetical protein [Georgenia sp. SUBG003]|uniref:hypothetical protein n=1 Tax=Georgenia sp. SUBG003 TaxID=1497974 RepID=UPI003AB777BF
MGLARAEPHSTVIVDLDVQFGDVATALNLAPEYSLLDAVHGPAARDDGAQDFPQPPSHRFVRDLRARFTGRCRRHLPRRWVSSGCSRRSSVTSWSTQRRACPSLTSGAPSRLKPNCCQERQETSLAGK